ncbi:hypothetical protein R6Z80_003362 [Salmonella enterica]|nr:hypothetical protein [Salmonella enterica]
MALVLGMGILGNRSGWRSRRQDVATDRQAVRAPGCLVTTLRPDASH